MNKYEIMFIVKPDVEDDARNALIENFKKVLTNTEGTVDNVNEWGLRDFAYEIKDYTKGYYVVVDTTTTPANTVDCAEILRKSKDIHKTISTKPNVLPIPIKILGAMLCA